MNPATYRDLGIPEDYTQEAFLYLPAVNTAVARFRLKSPPKPCHLFWRRAEDAGYTKIPVPAQNFSLESSMPAPRSACVYYSIMEWKNPAGTRTSGGYWVSLNRYDTDRQREEVVMGAAEFKTLLNSPSAWVSSIVHVAEDENYLDVVTGMDGPADDHHLTTMHYAVYRLDLRKRTAQHRLPMPAVFV